MKGKIVYGYTLLQPIGVGGMAEVWLAENKIGKKAAVKILLPKLCDDTSITSRFLIEAKIMVGLNHQNIRQVYDYGDIDGRPCIIMEYLEGEDLMKKLKRGEKFKEEVLKKWWNQLVSALSYTHQKDIVHRDIKPGNIFIDTNNNVKLLDFGIAKVRESIYATQILSFTGSKLGTLMYMSPEQIRDSKSVDYRTDIYSLAVTFVHLITGKKPYDENVTSDFLISEQIVYKSIDLSNLPCFWRDFLSPYLNKERAKRPPLKMIADKSSPKNARVDIKGGDDSTIIDGVMQPPKVGGNVSRSKKWIWILAVAVILLGGGITYNVVEKKKHDAERIAKLTELYQKKTKECDMFISSMVLDKEGNQANKHFTIVALTTLQDIEQMEKGPNFNKLGIQPISKKLFADYTAQLSEAMSLVEEKYNKQVALGLTDNSYCVDLWDQLLLMKNILDQSEQGCASEISIIPPEEL